MSMVNNPINLPLPVHIPIPVLVRQTAEDINNIVHIVDAPAEIPNEEGMELLDDDEIDSSEGL